MDNIIIIVPADLSRVVFLNMVIVLRKSRKTRKMRIRRILDITASWVLEMTRKLNTVVFF